jgi:hypothetical protein
MPKRFYSEHRPWMTARWYALTALTASWALFSAWMLVHAIAPAAHVIDVPTVLLAMIIVAAGALHARSGR